MKSKAIISLILSFVMMFSAISIVSATNIDDITSGNINVAIFDNAEQIKNKATNADIVSDYSITFSLGENGLDIQGEIEDTEFLVSGVLLTKNSRNTNLAYSATETDGKYNILYMCVDKETDKFVFLNNFVDNFEDYSNVIKLYMQEKSTGNYIMIEIYIEYDFVGNYLANNAVVFDEELSSEMFSWFTSHIESENGTEEVATRASNTRRFKRKYLVGTETLYYNLVLNFVANVNSIPRNGTSVSDIYVEVVTSNISDKDGVEDWGAQSALTIKNVNVSFATMPNTFVTAQQRISRGDLALDYHKIELRIATATEALNMVVTSNSTNYYTSQTFNHNGASAGVRLTSTGYTNMTNRTNYVEMYSVGDRYGFSVTVKDVIGTAKSGTATANFTFLVACTAPGTSNSTEYQVLNVTQAIN